MIFFYFLILLILSEVRCAINDACTAENVSNGVLKYYKTCAYAMNLADEKGKVEVRKLFKGKVGNKVLVCCPQRKVDKVCESFGKRPDEPDSLVSRIIGGRRAEVAEFPHFAALAFIVENKLSFDCGGALISTNFVLSAAHCCSKKQITPVIVRLGKVGATLCSNMLHRNL